MGGIRRSLFHASECDKAVEDMTIKLIRAVENSSSLEKLNKVRSEIAKLEE